MSKKYKYQKYFTFEGKRYAVRADDEKALIMKYANKLRDLNEGKVTVSGSMTVRSWTEKCIETYKTNVQQDTLKCINSRVNKHILAHIGEMQLKSVKPITLQDALNSSSGMGKTMIKKIYQDMNFIFEKAVENKLILENPAKHLVIPQGKDKKTRRSITEEERKHLLLVCQKEERFRVFLLMLYCGCRPGEARNAMGSDIEDIEGVHMLHIRGTKTKSADRYVPIPDILYAQIKDTEKTSPIAPDGRGKRRSSTCFDELSKSLRRAMNISMGCQTYRNALVPPYPLAEDFVPYCLRHTYCTDLCKAGVDIRVAQKLMGHASIQMTAQVYTHVDNGQIADIAGMIGASKDGTS